MKAKALAVLLLCAGCACGQTSDSSLYVKVRLNERFKASALKSGDIVEGALSQDVYSGDHELFSAGSQVRLVVEKLERRRHQPNDHWPWIFRLFTPRHENYPCFEAAIINPSDTPLHVSLISISRKVDVHTTGNRQPKGRSAPDTAPQAGTAGLSESPSAPLYGRKRPEILMTLEATRPVSEDPTTAKNDVDRSGPPTPVTLDSGTQAKVILLSGLSASKTKSGDLFQARLVEPVRVGTRVVLPEGTIFRGLAVRSTPPRRLSRSGSLLLKFTGLTLPGGNTQPLAASVAGAELDAASHAAIDPEGRLKASTSRVRMLINAGVSTGIAKVTDDGIQLVIEAISSTATDASTAGTSRIVALCASGLFMAVQHGRDVILPRYTEMDIIFDRPVTLSAAEPAEQRKLVVQEGNE